MELQTASWQSLLPAVPWAISLFSCAHFFELTPSSTVTALLYARPQGGFFYGLERFPFESGHMYLLVGLGKLLAIAVTVQAGFRVRGCRPLREWVKQRLASASHDQFERPSHVL